MLHSIITQYVNSLLTYIKSILDVQVISIFVLTFKCKSYSHCIQHTSKTANNTYGIACPLSHSLLSAAMYILSTTKHTSIEPIPIATDINQRQCPAKTKCNGKHHTQITGIRGTPKDSIKYSVLCT